MDELNYVKKFTEIYVKNKDNKYLREVYCHAFMHENNRMIVSSDDYFASCFPDAICGFGTRTSSFMYFCKIDELKKLYFSVDDVNKEEVQELIQFWENEADILKIQRDLPEELKKFMPTDNYLDNYYTAYPLYRLSGAYLDYAKLLRLGVDGLIEDIQKKYDDVQNEFLKAALETMKSFKKLLILYSEDAKKTNPELSDVLMNISSSAPQTLREAIQLHWMYVGVSEARNYGRLDLLFSKFVNHTADDYKCVLEYFKLIQKRNTIFNGRVVIGGNDRTDVENGDYLACIALEIMKQEHLTEPQLTLRCYEGMSSRVLDLAMECIKAGCSYPLLYSDEVNIKTFADTLNVDEKIASDYVPFGCGEYVLNNKSIASPNGLINLTKILEGLLNSGKCMLTDTPITKYHFDNPETFEEVIDVCKKELDYQIDMLAYLQDFEHQYMNSKAVYIHNSILYDDCLERGKGILEGGIYHLGGTLETYGNINFTDSLWAIKELVFERKEVKFSQVKEILMNNFEGKEDIRKLCLDAHKYGNDFDDVDHFTNEMNQYIGCTAKDKAKKYHMDSYLIVIINNHVNSEFGYRTAASFDGRYCHEPFANALTPQAGAEKSGITAMLNSVSSIDVTNMAGAVCNLKLSKDMMNKHLNEVKMLLKVFFEKGGSQIMISVMDKGELEDAMIHPEKYPNLIVRVGGFSAKFIDLDPLVQKEIISRTMY